MATIVKNDNDSISFINFFSGAKSENAPTLLVQAGDWDYPDGGAAVGFNFTVTGDITPLLSTEHARKLARWLQKTADYIDGVNETGGKKRKKRHFFEDDDDDMCDYKLR